MDPRIELSTPLVCPKCQGAMRAYERSGITVDQCTECRGIFLDRGELERLLDTEATPTRASARSSGRDDLDGGRRGSDDRHDRPEDAHDRDTAQGIPAQGVSRDEQPKDARRRSRFDGLFDLLGGGD